MVWSRREALRRRQEARHRWDTFFPTPLPTSASPSPPNPAEGLLDLAAAEPPAGPGPSDAASDPQRRRPRLAVSLRLGAVIAALLAASCAAWWWAAESIRPEVRSVSTVPEASDGDGKAPEPSTPQSPSPHPGGGPTVHVVGAVAAPGVYRLASGARVHEAVAAAGGATPGADVDRLNLAAPVEDGTRLRVPLAGEPESPEAVPPAQAPRSEGSAGGGATAPGGAAVKVNINTASVQELGALPRVGPVLAQRIVDYRSAHGRFAAPEDLDAVSGIGPKMLEALLPLVTVR